MTAELPKKLSYRKEEARPQSDADRVTRAIAMKEFKEYTRRPLILVLGAILAALALAATYVSALAAGQAGFAGLDLAVSALGGLSGLFIPVLAIVLAHASLAGEQESGSLGLLLAQPVSRMEVLLGKFIGLTAVLWAVVAIGFVGAGVVIGVKSGESLAGWLSYLRFTVSTLLFAAAYLAFFLLLSAAVSRRTPALLLGLGAAFFFSMVYPTLLALLAYQLAGAQGLVVPPVWIVLLKLVSIPALYLNLSQLAVGPTSEVLAQLDASGVSLSGAQFGTLVFTGVLLLWTALALAGGWTLLKKKDV